jgi:hypothetical protein
MEGVLSNYFRAHDSWAQDKRGRDARAIDPVFKTMHFKLKFG